VALFSDDCRDWLAGNARAIRRALRLRDTFDFLLLLLACGLAVNTKSESAVATAVFGTLYLVFLVVSVIVTIRERRTATSLEGEVLWGVFDLLYERVFKDHRVRMTLFKVDPLNPRYIIPWFRYEPGGAEITVAADRSRARYKKGEGHTGLAWESAARNEVQMAFFPAFPDRRSFEAFYCDQLGLDRATVARISDRMQSVGVILSCGFTDRRNKFLGVLSIDLDWQLVSENPPVFRDSRHNQRELKADAFYTIVVLVRTALRSLPAS